MKMHSDLGKKSGFTIIEVMIALLVLTILTVGGAAMMMRSGETIAKQRHKRAALEAANRRMEQVRAIPYTTFDAIGSAWRFLEPSGTTFTWSNSDPGETVTVNGNSLPIRTRARHVTLSSSGGNYSNAECLEIRVELEHEPASGDTIVLNSYYSQ